MTERSDTQTPLLEQWSAELTTRTGLPLYVRPVNPEDDKLVDGFFASLSHDDLRFRFLTPLARPCSSLLEALVAVDHVRTEDFLVFTDKDGEKQLIASAMLAADPDMERAEVAIAVRPEYKERGVGWTCSTSSPATPRRAASRRSNPSNAATMSRRSRSRRRWGSPRPATRAMRRSPWSARRWPERTRRTRYRQRP